MVTVLFYICGESVT